MSGSSPYQSGGAGTTKLPSASRIRLTPGPSPLKGTTWRWYWVTPGLLVQAREVPKPVRVASLAGVFSAGGVTLASKRVNLEKWSTVMARVPSAALTTRVGLDSRVAPTTAAPDGRVMSRPDSSAGVRLTVISTVLPKDSGLSAVTSMVRATNADP